LALGRTAEAAALVQTTLAVRERVLGADHPDTLKSRNTLALAYSALGRNAEAAVLDEASAGSDAARRPPVRLDSAVRASALKRLGFGNAATVGAESDGSGPSESSSHDVSNSGEASARFVPGVTG